MKGNLKYVIETLCENNKIIYELNKIKKMFKKWKLEKRFQWEELFKKGFKLQRKLIVQREKLNFLCQDLFQIMKIMKFFGWEEKKKTKNHDFFR